MNNMVKNRIGLLTIGQSPRADVTNDLKNLIHIDVEFVECGALDEFTYNEVVEKLAPEPSHTTYVTRMRDGRQVKISKEKIISYMQKCIYKLESKNVDLIIILCSGEFPEFKSKVPIVYPDKLLKSFVSALRTRGLTVVLIPIPEQVEYAKNKWSSVLPELHVEPISPYTSTKDTFRSLGMKLRNMDTKLIVMDCIGYTTAQRKIISEIVKNPIISTRSVIARLIDELYYK